MNITRPLTRPLTRQLTRPLSGGASGVSGAFSPLDIAGIHTWLDASDASVVLNAISPDTPATDGQTIRRINDKSGNGFNWNQATGINQPLYQTGEINGLGVASFDGSNDFLGGCLPASGNAATIFIVKRSTDTSFVMFYDVSSAVRYGYVGASGNGATTIHSNFGTPSLKVNGVAVSITTRGGIYTATDGTKVLSIKGGDIAAWSRADGNFAIGNYTGFTWTVDLAEVIVYSGYLSDTDEAAVNAYLMEKWGIS